MARPTPHYLRFAMALTGAAALGCGGRVIDTGGSGDAATSLPVSDSSAVDTAVTPTPAGRCIQRGSTSAGIGCSAGQVCTWVGRDGLLACTPPTTGDPAFACGSIFCSASWCDCIDPKSSTCACSGAIEGPLPPPDLPMV